MEDGQSGHDSDDVTLVIIGQHFVSNGGRAVR
jgi:hypothetical protein